MLDSKTSNNLINKYLEKCYTEQSRDLYNYVSEKFEELVNCYGWNKINTAIEACVKHNISEENDDWEEAAKKLSKHEIFEISTTIGFLCGIAEAELRRVR